MTYKDLGRQLIERHSKGDDDDNESTIESVQNA